MEFRCDKCGKEVESLIDRGSGIRRCVKCDEQYLYEITNRKIEILCKIFGHKWYIMGISDFEYQGKKSHTYCRKCRRCGEEETKWITGEEYKYFKRCRF